MLDEVERGSVDIAVARLDAREQPGAPVEDAAEEHPGAQHLGLVDASQHAGPALRLAPLGEPEAEIEEGVAGRPGDHTEVSLRFVRLRRGRVARRERVWQ